MSLLVIHALISDHCSLKYDHLSQVCQEHWALGWATTCSFAPLHTPCVLPTASPGARPKSAVCHHDVPEAEGQELEPSVLEVYG